MRDVGQFLLAIGLFSVVLAIIMITVWSYQFDKGCGDWLKLAGDAPSVEMADRFLGTALVYIEKNKLTKGNSALIFQTPEHDLALWHEKVTVSKQTTEGLLARFRQDSTSVSHLERSNVLMKIRETLLDDDSEGTVVTLPAHISLFPNQWAVTYWELLSILMVLVGGTIIRRSRYRW